MNVLTSLPIPCERLAVLAMNGQCAVVLLQALPRGDSQPATDDVYDSDSSGSVHQGPSGNNNNNNSNSNNSVKLLRQNQRLLSEVERLVCELQAAKHRVSDIAFKK